MQLPTVHLNGTSAESLMAQYGAAVRAVQRARDALMAVEVHDRDYYVVSAAAGPQARVEHQRRIASLQGVIDELVAIWMSVQQQQTARKRGGP